ncbi:MAG: T9SS type A sorting domain-containing protein [Ignavibacteriaceae bacterium]|nr:T9SS type A sorting domain-containing protein [Ignavibacteriaceae bacterium]
MKTAVLLISLLMFYAEVPAVNGKILTTGNNITIVKVWGTHTERGYAQGFLLAAKIDAIYRNYIAPKFGPALSVAKATLLDSLNFSIDSAYVQEAKGLVAGMADAGITGYDYGDLLLANSLLDLSSILSAQYTIDFNLGCSSLMSWGDATQGTALNGKSVISRNLDWEVNSNLNNNQVMVIHIPSEENEQPWIMIGFAGQISALSGTNRSGVSAFQHVLSGVAGHSAYGKKYIPVWFGIRKGLESKDLNGDGADNTNDMRHSLLQSVNGMAPNCIVSVGASAANLHDSLIAMVAEVTNTAPYHSFRTNSYEDKIPGDNLYAANSAICRNDARQYCSRYNSLTTAIAAGTGIDSLLNWTLLRDYSRVVGTNIQMMQIIPELKQLKLSVYTGTPAYNAAPYIYNLDTIFDKPFSVDEITGEVNERYSLSQNYPNPFGGAAQAGNCSTVIKYTLPANNDQRSMIKVTLKVFDVLGREVATLVDEELAPGSHYAEFNAGKNTGSYSGSGVYFYRLIAANDVVITKKMLIIK